MVRVPLQIELRQDTLLSQYQMGVGTSEVNAGATLRWTKSNRGTNWGVKILLVASRYRNQDRLEPGGPVGLYVGYLPISVMLWVPRHGLVLIS